MRPPSRAVLAVLAVFAALAALGLGASAAAAQDTLAPSAAAYRARRERAMQAAPDGLLLVRASPDLGRSTSRGSARTRRSTT
jgi:hypothetical protein